MEKYKIDVCEYDDILSLLDIQECTNYTHKMLKDMIDNERTIFLKAIQNASIIGYCALEIILDEAEIHTIAVQHKHRKKGIAKQLVKACIAKSNAKKVFLEVNEENEAAINLYKGLGFMPISKRQKYYGDNDAIIMELCPRHQFND